MTEDQHTAAPRAGGDRIGWTDVPATVRDWTERTLDGHVVDAASQNNGFSPGAACRLLLHDGRRAFVKAVSGAVNEESARLHRTEAGIMRAMPSDIPVPALLDSYDDGQWVALLLTDVAGRTPAQPWRQAELAQVIDALDRLHERLTPAPVDGAPKVVDLYRDVFRGWRRMAGGATVPPDDDAFRTRLDRLAELEGEWTSAAAGTTLLHGDLRADNMLITEDGVILVDWPWAAIGAPFDGSPAATEGRSAPAARPRVADRRRPTGDGRPPAPAARQRLRDLHRHWPRIGRPRDRGRSPHAGSRPGR